MRRQRSSSDSNSSFDHGSDVSNQGLIQENVESVNTGHGWLPSPVANVGTGLMLEETHSEQNNHTIRSSGLVTHGSTSLQSATSDAHEDSDEDAYQEIGADPVNQSSSLEQVMGLLLRNTRRRINLAHEQDFSDSSWSSASPVGSSQLFQPSYRSWGTIPSFTSNPANFPFIASNGGYEYYWRQQNSQYIPRSTSMQSILVSWTERGIAAPAGTQLSPPLGFPQENTTRSFPSTFTYGVHLPSAMRYAGIDIGTGGQVGYQIPPSSISVAMRDIIGSRFGNARAFQAAPLEAFMDAQTSARLRRTVRQAFDILQADGMNGSFFPEEEPDVHENMHLDVDNMSYEDLLALDDHIGNVGSGLTEETVLGALMRLTYQSMRLGAPVEEMCCICQENFVDSDQLGILDCGHKYHADCIKQWLLNKNTCPICQKTALAV